MSLQAEIPLSCSFRVSVSSSEFGKLDRLTLTFCLVDEERPVSYLPSKFKALFQADSVIKSFDSESGRLSDSPHHRKVSAFLEMLLHTASLSCGVKVEVWALSVDIRELSPVIAGDAARSLKLRGELISTQESREFTSYLDREGGRDFSTLWKTSPHLTT